MDVSSFKLNLKKPLVFFDLETTGINITSDRIVEICVVKLTPQGEKIVKTHKINPTIPIPIESSLIHGIYDEDVKDNPTFAQLAQSLNQFLVGCDLGGFNIIRFDVPVLVEEFLRVNIDFDITHRKLIDAQRIYHLMEPRSLTAAYKFYCNKDLQGAHSAEVDTLATADVFVAQVQQYDGRVIKDVHGKESSPIVNDMAALHELTALQFADLAGRLGFNDKGEEVFNFGKYKNMTVTEVFKKDPSYYDWIMKGDFALYTKKKVTEIKLRNFNLK